MAAIASPADPVTKVDSIARPTASLGMYAALSSEAITEFSKGASLAHSAYVDVVIGTPGVQEIQYWYEVRELSSGLPKGVCQGPAKYACLFRRAASSC